MSTEVNEPEDEVASNHEQRSDHERVPVDPALHHALVRPDHQGIAAASGGGNPAIEDPLPGLDELVTVRTLEAIVQRQWVGPMADPETLASYEAVLPGMAERLLKVYESQTVQVSNREDQIVKNQHAIDQGGQAWAGVLALVCVLAGIPMLALGNIAGGGIILGMPVVLLVASFIPSAKGKEKAEKTEA